MAVESIIHSKLLAAASSASDAATSIIEAARNETIHDAEDVVAVLVDAIRLVGEARQTAQAGEERLLSHSDVVNVVDAALEDTGL